MQSVRLCGYKNFFRKISLEFVSCRWGDKNSKKIYPMVKLKKLQQSLVSTQDGPQCLEDGEAIQDHIASHYKNLLYSVDENVNTGIVERVIPSLVKAEDNISLLRVPIPNEVYPTVKSMDCSSFSWPDRFSGCFFVTCWSTVGPDVVQAIQNFFVD